eukprot:1161841-Pelagomonas_calceolata.AAC.3
MQSLAERRGTWVGEKLGMVAGMGGEAVSNKLMIGQIVRGIGVRRTRGLDLLLNRTYSPIRKCDP